jgi:hypothetical protein
MKKLRDASEGLSNFPVFDKILIRTYLFYLFIIPAVSIIGYELLLDDVGEKQTPTWWNWLFFIPIVMQIGFVINNLKVPGTSIGLLLMIIRIPAEVVVMSYLFEWDIFYALSIIFAIELFGFCIGLLMGTMFRKAAITAKHRLASFLLVVGIVALVYFRFELIFYMFINPDKNSILQIISGIVCIVIAALPHIRVFVAGKDDVDVKMGTSDLSDKMTPAVAISAVVYAFILPLVLYFILEGF